MMMTEKEMIKYEKMLYYAGFFSGMIIGAMWIISWHWVGLI
jgi:hypothetical protein